jgi:hypothetical protein
MDGSRTTSKRKMEKWKLMDNSKNKSRAVSDKHRDI